jgi:hypothetical protein
LAIAQLDKKHSQELDVLGYQVLALNGGRHRELHPDNEELISLQFKLRREDEHKMKLTEKLSKALDEIEQWKVSFITLLSVLTVNTYWSRSWNAMS